MNNYYILRHLTQHLNDLLTGGTFTYSYSPHKDVWEGYMHHSSDKIRLIFSTNSSETALFADRYRAPKKSNITTFFASVYEDIVTDVTLADNDRFVYLHFSSGKTLLFKLFGNHPNVLLTENSTILESFKSGADQAGDSAPAPRSASGKQDLPADDLSAKRKITGIDPKFPRHLIQPVIEHYGLGDASSEDVAACVQKLTGKMISSPEFRVLDDGNLCLIPESDLPVSTRKTFDTVNEAIRFAYYKTSRERRFSARIQSLKPKLETAIRKHESNIKQLSNADKSLERAERYEQFGHILMAHAHESVSPDKNQVRYPNFYDDNKPVEISIKPKLSIAENAQKYYDKSAKAIRNMEESRRRLKQVSRELDELRDLHESLSGIEKIYEFDDWYKENEPRLDKLGILAKTQTKTSLPYRRARIDGHEIWIGKNAKSNDRLTSDAHKEDVWLHARGVSGSHVVIRMNNRKEMPDKSIILKAASIAAYHSKARGSKLAPVMVAKRKHITKPKGAPAGAVRVHHETVEMVEPQKLP